MTSLHLAKLHATGNDFLVRLALGADDGYLAPETVAFLCDRRLGVGADGLITVGAGDAEQGFDCTMRLQNADGGDAEMSGNGIRCLAWVAARAGLGTEQELIVDTAAGRRVVSLIRDAGGEVVEADVDMGPVTLGDEDVEIVLDGVEYWGDVANVGNPHLVCFVDRSRGGSGRVARAAHRARRAVPRPHERRVHPGAPAGRDRHAGLGAGRRRDAVVRHRRVRGHRGGAPPRASSTTSSGSGARRRAAGRRSARRCGWAVRSNTCSTSRSTCGSNPARSRPRDRADPRHIKAGSAGVSPRPRSISVASASAPSSSAPPTAPPRSKKRRRRSKSSRCSPTPRAPSPCTPELQRRRTPDPATYIGKGKADELRDARRGLDIDVVIFDDELTPAAATQPREALRGRRRRSRRA